MRFKIDFSLPKWVRFRVGVRLGADVGARLDVRLRLRGRDPLRWKAALGPSGKSRARELPEVTLPPGGELPRV